MDRSSPGWTDTRVGRADSADEGGREPWDGRDGRDAGDDGDDGCARAVTSHMFIARPPSYLLVEE